MLAPDLPVVDNLRLLFSWPFFFLLGITVCYSCD